MQIRAFLLACLFLMSVSAAEIHGKALSKNEEAWISSYVKLTMDKACRVTGYTAASYQMRLRYAQYQYKRGDSFEQIASKIKDAMKNQRTCGRNLTHVDQSRTQFPPYFGGTFNGSNQLLSPKRNNSYYKYGSYQGHPQVSAHMGFYTQRVGIAIPANGKSQESVGDALRSISEMRDAGYQYAWPVIYLKGDCCEENKMPTAFGNPNDENEVYRRIHEYAYEVMEELLSKSVLPINVVEVGNELDGGFWTDFDLKKGQYSGPPARMDRTKRVVKAAKDGIIRAYKKHGMTKPFFQLHLMPDINFTYKKNLELMNAFLSEEFVGERLYDNVGFSYYPNARAGLNPKESAERLLALGEASGLPWGIAEIGYAQELAPGGPGAPYGVWNHFADYREWCPKLFKQPCANGLEYQQKLLAFTHDIFRRSERFSGSIYLAPQDNVLATSEGQRSIFNDGYRLSLWIYDPFVVMNSSQAGQMAPAFETFAQISNQMNRPVIDDVGMSCPWHGECYAWLWGKNFHPNTRIEFSAYGTGRLIQMVHSDEYHFESPSVISFAISPKMLEVFIAQPLEVEAINYSSQDKDIRSGRFPFTLE